MTPTLGQLCDLGPALDLNALLKTTGFTNPSVIMREEPAELHVILKRNQYDRQRVWLTNDRNWDCILNPAGRFGVEHLHARLSPDLDLIDAHALQFPRIASGGTTYDAADDVKIIEWNSRLHLLGSCVAVSSRHDGSRWKVTGLLTRMFLAPFTDGQASPVDVLPPFFDKAPLDKNWVARERSGGDLLLSIDFNRNIWIAIAPGSTGKVRMPPHGLQWNGGWSGSSSLVSLQDGEYLAVVHRTVSVTPSRYIHMLVVCDRHFKVRRRSQPFTFEGKMIEFCQGLTREPRSRDLLLSYGVWDRDARLVRLSEKSALALCSTSVDDPRELYEIK